MSQFCFTFLSDHIIYIQFHIQSDSLDLVWFTFEIWYSDIPFSNQTCYLHMPLTSLQYSCLENPMDGGTW